LTPKDVSDNIQKVLYHATKLRLVKSQKNKDNNISDSNALLVNVTSCKILQLYVRKWMQLTISSVRHL